MHLITAMSAKRSMITKTLKISLQQQDFVFKVGK